MYTPHLVTVSGTSACVLYEFESRTVVTRAQAIEVEPAVYQNPVNTDLEKVKREETEHATVLIEQ